VKQPRNLKCETKINLIVLVVQHPNLNAKTVCHYMIHRRETCLFIQETCFMSLYVSLYHCNNLYFFTYDLFTHATRSDILHHATLSDMLHHETSDIITHATSSTCYIIRSPLTYACLLSLIYVSFHTSMSLFTHLCLVSLIYVSFTRVCRFPLIYVSLPERNRAFP